MELESGPESQRRGDRRLMQRNKVYAVMTLARVAQDLGESEDLLDELTDQMDTEDGLIWVYGTDDHHGMAFSDDGIECLKELIANHRGE
jgi:hypothetical protein